MLILLLIPIVASSIIPYHLDVNNTWNYVESPEGICCIGTNSSDCQCKNVLVGFGQGDVLFTTNSEGSKSILWWSIFCSLSTMIELSIENQSFQYYIDECQYGQVISTNFIIRNSTVRASFKSKRDCVYGITTVSCPDPKYVLGMYLTVDNPSGSKHYPVRIIGISMIVVLICGIISILICFCRHSEKDYIPIE